MNLWIIPVILIIIIALVGGAGLVKSLIDKGKGQM